MNKVKLFQILNDCYIKVLIATICLLLSPFFLQSQSDTSYQQLFKIEDVEYFTIDPLQNIYCLSSSGELTKYDPSGKVLFSWSNTTLGAVTFIDASDPFNILLFYAEQQNLVLLDRTLNERSRLDLRASEIGQAAAVALSFDNNIWIYDDYEGILVKMDEHSNILLKSDFLGLSVGINQPVRHIFRWKDMVLVNFPEKGIAVFDLSAQLKDWWFLPGILDGQVLERGFSYYNNKGHFVYYPAIDLVQSVDSPLLNEYTMMRTAFSKQYLLSKEGVLFVSLKHKKNEK